METLGLILLGIAVSYLAYRNYVLDRDLNDRGAIIGALTDKILSGNQSEQSIKDYVDAIGKVDYRVGDRYWSQMAKHFGIAIEYDATWTISEATELAVTRAMQSNEQPKK
jgi:hypothetical protein